MKRNERIATLSYDLSTMTDITFRDLRECAGDDLQAIVEHAMEHGVFFCLDQGDDEDAPGLIWDGAIDCVRRTRVGDAVPGDGGTELVWIYAGSTAPHGQGEPIERVLSPTDLFRIEGCWTVPAPPALFSDDEEFDLEEECKKVDITIPERKAPTLRTAITSVFGKLSHDQQRSFLEALQTLTNEHAISEAFGAETAYELVEGLHDACYDKASDEVTGW